MIPTILTLDVGTTSVKVSQFTCELRLLNCVRIEYSLDSKGVFVQAPAERYLEAIRSGITQLTGRESIAAISVTTQGETLIPVKADGTPLCPAIVWLDARARRQAAKLRSSLSEKSFYETTGLPEIGDSLPLAKLLWLREEMPGLYAQVYKFLLLEDYILWWLTGRFVTEKSLQTSTGWFNLQRDEYWQEALFAAGVDESRLPEALECGQPVGALLSDRARELDLPDTAVIITGAMDQTAAALAAGCTHTGTVTETTGTALVMAACTDKPVFTDRRRITVYRHALPGKYIYLPIGNTAGMALKWFRNEFCRDLPQESAYTRMDDLADSVPCGCGGLLFLPYLSGSVNPDFLPGATGAFFGARLSSTRAHFVRAVMESVAYQVADFLSLLASMGCKAETVVSLGGGARSALWMQMKADVCERPFRIPDCTEAASTGAALLAAWGKGLLPPDTLPVMGSSRIYTPRPETFEAYRLQRECVHRVYQTIKPLYEQEEKHEQ